MSPQALTYGLLADRPRVPIFLRQTVADNALPAVSLGSTPLLGSVLVACVIGNTATTGGSISGGGVTTWTQIAATSVSGASNRAVTSWMGRVDGTPSSSLSIAAAAGNLSACVGEFCDLGSATILGSNSTSGTAYLHNAALSVAGRGLVVLILGTGASGAPEAPGDFVLAINAVNSADLRIYYLPIQYPGNTTLVVSSAFAGNRNSAHLAIIG